MLFALGVELLAGGVALDSETAARLGAGVLVLAAFAALGSAAETVRRVVVARP